jgi:hypothetical protein
MLILIIVVIAALFLVPKLTKNGSLSFGRRGNGSGSNNALLIAGAAIVLFLLFGQKILGTLGSAIGANTYTEIPGSNVNSCGCNPGENVLVRYNPLIGKTRTNNMTCQSALSLLSAKPKRASIIGCTTQTT